MKKLLVFIFFILLSIQLISQEFSVTFDHHALAVYNIEESVDFYKNVLQLEQIDTPVEISFVKWFSMGKNLQLHLIETKDLDLQINKGNHFCFRVQDIYEFVVFLDSKNIPFWDWEGKAHEITLRPDGVHQIYIKDPNGYWIEI